MTPSRTLKKAYLELDGKDYNPLHYQRNRRRYLKMIDAALPVAESARILDIGAGLCYLTKLLKLKGHEVRAIDFFYGDLTRSRCEKNNIPYFHLNIEADTLPFEKNFFDIVFLGEVIEHFTYSPLTPLGKIKRVLKRDGTLIITTPNRFRPFEAFKILRGAKIIGKPRDEPILYKGKIFYYRHNKLYSMKELRQVINRAGFSAGPRGFVSEGMSFKDNPLRIFMKGLFLPFHFLVPQTRDYLWITAKKRF